MRVVSRNQLKCLIALREAFILRYDVTLASGDERLRDGGQPALIDTPQHD